MSKPIDDELKQQMLTEFIHGLLDESGVRRYPSIDALSRNHDVARASIYRLAKAENWQGQKNEYQTELQNQINKERMDKAVMEANRLDDTCLQISMAMLTVVGRTLQKHMEAEARNNPEYEGLPAHVMSHLSTTTANAQKIGKLALGEAQEISKVAADVSNPEAFRAVMEQLDQLASARSQGDSEPLH